MTRFLRNGILAALAFCAAAAGAGGDGEARFRTRRYRSDKTAPDKAYKPSKQAAFPAFRSKPYEPGPAAGKPAAGARKTFTPRPYVPRDAGEPPDLPVYVGKPAADEKPYEQREKIAAKSIPPDPRHIQEKKPYISRPGGEGPDKPFQPPPPPKGKNPILRPMQGIREAPHDDE